jgi:hypothetical protein
VAVCARVLKVAGCCLQALAMAGSNGSLKAMLHLARQLKRTIEQGCEKLGRESRVQQREQAQQEEGAGLAGVEQMEACAMEELKS